MTDAKDLDWRPAWKRPRRVEVTERLEEPREVQTMEGHLEVVSEYIEEHGGYRLIRGVEGEVYPIAEDVYQETYDEATGGPGWYHLGEPMANVRVIDVSGTDGYVVSGYTESRGLVSYWSDAPVPTGLSLDDFCGEADELSVVDSGLDADPDCDCDNDGSGGLPALIRGWL